MRDRTTDLALAGIELTDARTGAPLRPAGLAGVHTLTLIRHRY